MLCYVSYHHAIDMNIIDIEITMTELRNSNVSYKNIKKKKNIKKGKKY